MIITPSLVESVREMLIADIMERNFRPGQKLPILEIAQRYGVSETPVKQAFNRLVSEGLLELLPRRGAVVRNFSKDEVRELMEARQILNLACVDASLSCSPQEREGMKCQIEEQLLEHEKLLEEITDKLDIDQYMRYVAIDKAYHLIYLKSIKNRVLERVFEQLRLQAYAYVSLSEIMAQRLREALEDHREIYQAWCEKDYGRLKDALNQHKERAIRAVNLIFEKEWKDEEEEPTIA